MSLENLKEYAQRCANEPELRERAKAIGTDIDEHICNAKSLGLEWSRQDMLSFRDELIDSGDLADLSDEELEQVAGGAVTITAIGVAAGVAGVVAGSAVGTAASVGATAAVGRGGW